MRSFEIVAKIREDLSVKDKEYIDDIIQKLMRKYHLKKDSKGLIYKEQERQFDDFVPCSSFYLDLFDYEEYFDILEYNSYLEGVMHGSLHKGKSGVVNKANDKKNII